MDNKTIIELLLKEATDIKNRIRVLEDDIKTLDNNDSLFTNEVVKRFMNDLKLKKQNQLTESLSALEAISICINEIM